MTTLEAQHEVITDLLLENQKLKQERDEAREKYDLEATEHMLAINKICNERDEARNKMADALQEIDLRTLDFERTKQKRDELLIELEEYRSIAENIGALKAVSEKEIAIRERDKMREVLMVIEDRCVDCEDACDDIQKIRDIAREALEK